MTERESAPNQTPDMEPAIRAIAMPADANGNGDIFGGWIMSQMDLAGGNVASVAVGTVRTLCHATASLAVTRSVLAANSI